MARRRAPRALAYSDGMVRPPGSLSSSSDPGGRRRGTAGSANPLRHRALSPGMVTDSDGKTEKAPGQADWRKAVESAGLEPHGPERPHGARPHTRPPDRPAIRPRECDASHLRRRGALRAAERSDAAANVWDA